jgi:hypothetical protein
MHAELLLMYNISIFYRSLFLTFRTKKNKIGQEIHSAIKYNDIENVTSARSINNWIT